MNKEEKRGIFLGILGIVILLLAIVGASYAWFTARDRSEDNVVRVKAAEMQIVYVDGREMNVTGLIPGKENIVFETVRRALAGEFNSKGEKYTVCQDDKGHTVCGVYNFEVTNNVSESVSVMASIEPGTLEEGETKFTNLKYAIYDTSSDEINGSKLGTGNITYNTFDILGSNYNVPEKSTKKFRIIVWLDEVGEDNNIEQGATFRGRVTIKDKR